MAQLLLSDAESDSYSLLEAPRPSTQALMAQAISEGRLRELVLEGQAELSRSIALCLEVLGLGTSPPERQWAAARALVALCTHRKLRPAVDNLLVLRRLCRVIELTDSPAALEAAAEALFAVADDAAWRTKGGATSEVVREALGRCVGVLTTIAKPSAGGDGESDPTALAAAAAAVLKAPVLHLLSPDERTEAAAALAACIASGYGGPAVFTALSAVVQYGPTDKDRTGLAMAAVGCKGTVAALLAAVASGVECVSQLGDAAKDSSGSGGTGDSGGGLGGANNGSSGGGGGRGCKQKPRAGGRVLSDATEPATAQMAAAAQLTTTAQSAFTCLTEVLAACTADRNIPRANVITRSSSSQLGIDDLTGLLDLLQLEPKDASRALHALLVLISLSGVADVEAAVAAAIHQRHLMEAAFAAAKTLIGDSAATDFSDGSCAAALLHIVSDLLQRGAMNVEQLRQLAPGLTEAALGVLACETPGAAWRGLFASAAAAAAATRRDPTPVVQYPDTLMAAAAQLACHLMEWATAVQPSAGNARQAMRPDLSKIADALIRRVVAQAAGGNQLLAELGGWGCRCLTLSLQLSPVDAQWAKYGTRDLAKFIQPVAGAVREGGSQQQDALQLAAVTLLSLWTRVQTTPTATNDTLDVLEAVLNLATSALTSAVTNAAAGKSGAQSAQQQQQQLAELAGVLNAVVGCLQPQLALTGPACQPLSPVLPKGLLPPVSAADAGGASGQASLLKATYSVSSKSITGPVYNIYSGVYGSPPTALSMQLQWQFEARPQPAEAWEPLVAKLAQHTQGYSITFDAGRATVASSTAQPLLQALGTAAARLSELVEAQLQPSAGEGEGVEGAGGGGMAAEAALLLRAAVRVSGNTAKLLGMCIPAGKTDF